LEDCIRDSDTAARFGGDEFTILLENIKEQKNAACLAEKIYNSFARPFTILEHAISISASIGISIYPEDSQEAKELLKYADQAMYATKKAGKKGYQFFGQSQKK
jgi:diguanylate cyclase (GGDEF)-like protein